MIKYIFILVFFFFSTFLTFAQSDSLSNKRSVVSLDKVKTIYRGIANPISIAVSGCKSFEVTGLGVIEVSKGKYTLSPGQGTEVIVTVKITNFDDSISVEEHNFSIRNFTNAITTINESYCRSCTLLFKKVDLKDAHIGVNFQDLNIDYNSEVVEFTIKIPNKESIVIKGNRITDEVYKLFKNNQSIVISEIKTKFEGLGNIIICRIPPIFLKVD